jgi:hypothetical protein
MDNFLLVRFLRRFFGDFGRTMREDKLSYAAIPATLFWFLVNRNELRADVWIIIGPLIWGASFVVCQHAFSAVRSLVRDIETENAASEVRTSPILDSSGHQTITITYPSIPRFYGLKLYALFATILGFCVLACICAEQQARIKAANVHEDGNANLEVTLETPKWNERTSRYEMDAVLVSSGNFSAQKFAAYPKYWLASSTTGDRPTKEQIDRRFKAFEEETKYKPLGYNDIGIKQQVRVPLKTEFIPDEDHEAVERGKKWMYIFVIIKYADKTHNEIWSRACGEYERGIGVTCEGHNEAADLRRGID